MKFCGYGRLLRFGRIEPVHARIGYRLEEVGRDMDEDIPDDTTRFEQQNRLPIIFAQPIG